MRQKTPHIPTWYTGKLITRHIYFIQFWLISDYLQDMYASTGVMDLPRTGIKPNARGQVLWKERLFNAPGILKILKKNDWTSEAGNQERFLMFLNFN